MTCEQELVKMRAFSHNVGCFPLWTFVVAELHPIVLPKNYKTNMCLFIYQGLHGFNHVRKVTVRETGFLNESFQFGERK